MIQEIEFRRAQDHDFYTYNYIVPPGQVVGQKKKVRLYGKDFWFYNQKNNQLEKYTIDATTNTAKLVKDIKKGLIYLPKQ